MMKSRRPSSVTALIDWLPAPLNVRSDCQCANHQRSLADVTFALAHQLAIREHRVEQRHRGAHGRHLHVEERAAVGPQRAPDRQDQHDVDEIADQRVQPGAETRLVQPRAGEQGRAAVQDT